MKLGKLVILLLLSVILIRPEPAESQFTKTDPATNEIIPNRFAVSSDFDGSSLTFCRGYYKQIRQEEEVIGWSVDYPKADYNLLMRFALWTKIRVKFDANRQPIFVVIPLDSPLIFNCQVLFLSDVGTIGFSKEEMTNLRNYLEKGGFLWADDFWGSRGWKHWEIRIRQVLPSGPYPMIDIPLSHPVMNQPYYIPDILQIPHMNFWYQNGGQTSERGEDSREVHFRGIEDEHGRLMVIMTHNTDIGDTWEEFTSDPQEEYLAKFSKLGFELGTNIFIYALTH